MAENRCRIIGDQDHFLIGRKSIAVDAVGEFRVVFGIDQCCYFFECRKIEKIDLHTARGFVVIENRVLVSVFHGL
jgi:hypothetical protein